MKLLVKFFLIIFFFKNPVFAESYFTINKFSKLSGKSEYEKMEILKKYKYIQKKVMPLI